MDPINWLMAAIVIIAIAVAAYSVTVIRKHRESEGDDNNHSGNSVVREQLTGTP